MDKEKLWKLLAEIRQIALLNQKIISQILVVEDLPADVIPILAEWYRHDGKISMQLSEKLRIIESAIMEEMGLRDEKFHTYNIDELLKNAGD